MSSPVRLELAGHALWVVAMIGSVVVLVMVYAVTLYRWASAGLIGWDVGHYFDAARRFVATGSPYLPSDVAAPFVTYNDLTFLHPPVSLYLVVPFASLPVVLWWAVPVIGTVALVVSMRPARWTWPLLIGLVCWPTLAIATANGNSDLWVLFGVTAGLRHGWPAIGVVAKPSMLPLMFTGIRHRTWWVGAVLVAALCVPFGALWPDWVTVVRNSPGGLTYSLASMIPMLMPLLAWSARRRGTVSSQIRVS